MRTEAYSSQFNYVLSAAMDVGTALSILVIFFALDLPGASVKWWGNTVYQNSEQSAQKSRFAKVNANDRVQLRTGQAIALSGSHLKLDSAQTHGQSDMSVRVSSLPSWDFGR